MVKINTYCQNNFLIFFYKSLAENFLPLDEKSNIYIKIHELFSSKSILFIDSKKSLIKNIDNNPYIKRLIKGSTEGMSKIIELPNHFENIKAEFINIKINTDPFSLYYFYNLQSIHSTNIGFCIMDKENFLDQSKKVLSEIKTIKVHIKKELNYFKGWDNLFSNLPPRNSLILADNYIMKNSNRPSTNNIFKIIKYILPEKLNDTDFHLTIITSEKLIDIPKDKKTIFNDIKAYIESLNKDYKIKFGIFFTSNSKLHDRHIISNYFRLTSGNSFNYFDYHDNIKTDTELTYIPITSTKDSYLNHIKLIETLAFYTNNCYYLGDKENRLLDNFR